MKDTDQLTLQRLQSSIVADKRFKPDNLTKIIKSEIYNILENYFLLSPENLSVNLSINENGFIDLSIHAQAKRSKVIGVLPDENSFI